MLHVYCTDLNDLQNWYMYVASSSAGVSYRGQKVLKKPDVEAPTYAEALASCAPCAQGPSASGGAALAIKALQAELTMFLAHLLKRYHLLRIC